MKIGVLGSGDVAKTLASGFLKHGHSVKVGSRTPAKLADWSAQNSGSSVGTFAEAAEFGELLVVAVKGNGAAEALPWPVKTIWPAKRSSTPVTPSRTLRPKKACCASSQT
jgi:3-hydroxyisobutyrate dehydrogenase-like beta-hydroxyacid dehydrogenase